MAHTRESLYSSGSKAGWGDVKNHTHTANPFKAGSWQAQSWATGYEQGRRGANADDRNIQAYGEKSGERCERMAPARESGAEQLKDRLQGSTLVPFPDRMPMITRLHCASLDQRARNTKDSTLANRLDRKITNLYERWA